MTRRERLERKLEKRHDWAASRHRKAAHGFAQAEPYRGDVAFNTQPGHIPERARVIRATERAFEDTKMAQHHEQKAAGLAHQLDRAIFSDDDNAVEALKARIAENLAKREHMTARNKAYRKGLEAFAAFEGCTIEQAEKRRETIEAGYSWCRQPHPAYELSNLGGRIRADRERLVAIEARQERTAAAEASPSGVTIEGDAYVRVTFAEKPARSVLDALKAAGFRWSRGSWVGERTKLPAEVPA